LGKRCSARRGNYGGDGCSSSLVGPLQTSTYHHPPPWPHTACPGTCRCTAAPRRLHKTGAATGAGLPVDTQSQRRNGRTHSRRQQLTLCKHDLFSHRGCVTQQDRCGAGRRVFSDLQVQWMSCPISSVVPKTRRIAWLVGPAATPSRIAAVCSCVLGRRRTRGLRGCATTASPRSPTSIAAERLPGACKWRAGTAAWRAPSGFTAGRWRSSHRCSSSPPSCLWGRCAPACGT